MGYEHEIFWEVYLQTSKATLETPLGAETDVPDDSMYLNRGESSNWDSRLAHGL